MKLATDCADLGVALPDSLAELAELDEAVHDEAGRGILTAREEATLARHVWAAARLIRAANPRPPVRVVTLRQVEEAERLLPLYSLRKLSAMTGLDLKTLQKIRRGEHPRQMHRAMTSRCPSCGARVIEDCRECHPRSDLNVVARRPTSARFGAERAAARSCAKNS